MKIENNTYDAMIDTGSVKILYTTLQQKIKYSNYEAIDEKMV